MTCRIYNYPIDNPHFAQTIQQEVENEFGDNQFINQYKWSKPDWSVLMFDGSKHILSFYNIVKRTCLFDGIEMNVAGVNNLITPKRNRGFGYGASLIRNSKEIFFDQLDMDFGLLLCADKLVGYFNKLGWYKAGSDLWFHQPGGKKQWTANVMLLGRKEAEVHPDIIDLNGLPW